MIGLQIHPDRIIIEGSKIKELRRYKGYCGVENKLLAIKKF